MESDAFWCSHIKIYITVFVVCLVSWIIAKALKDRLKTNYEPKYVTNDFFSKCKYATLRNEYEVTCSLLEKYEDLKKEESSEFLTHQEIDTYLKDHLIPTNKAIEERIRNIAKEKLKNHIWYIRDEKHHEMSTLVRELN